MRNTIKAIIWIAIKFYNNVLLLPVLAICYMFGIMALIVTAIISVMTGDKQIVFKWVMLMSKLDVVINRLAIGGHNNTAEEVYDNIMDDVMSNM